jgi:hypothetical protein
MGSDSAGAIVADTAAAVTGAVAAVGSDMAVVRMGDHRGGNGRTHSALAVVADTGD